MSDPPTGRPRGPVRPGSVEAAGSQRLEGEGLAGEVEALKARIDALEKKNAQKDEEKAKLLAALRAVHGDERLFRF